jgi:carbonic anhydrase/acetyltransferase-like protein (isoleucine patch superfamily)
VILWSGNHIGHDSTIEDHVFIASHAVVSGNCRIGESSFVGVNATFRDGITVAPRCVIGAGALIMKDTVEGGVYSVRGTDPLEKKSWDLNL